MLFGRQRQIKRKKGAKMNDLSRKKTTINPKFASFFLLNIYQKHNETI